MPTKKTEKDYTPSKQAPMLCRQPPVTPRVLSPTINPNRANLIVNLEKIWANGTTINYYFFDRSTDGRHFRQSNGTSQFRGWASNDAEKEVVRGAFNTWKELGIGLEFREVDNRESARVRIGFERGDGFWSFLGRDVLSAGRDERTMNFGQDLTVYPGAGNVAVHEIGHTLGFPHAHQNPNSGISWNEEKVYADLAEPPNEWPRDVTFDNILRKIPRDDVWGSDWDPNSIMHYDMPASWINAPEPYATQGVDPTPGLSPLDIAWVRQFYPLLQPETDPELKPLESRSLALAPGEQKNFIIKPNETRYYDISTFGESDTVVVLFEKNGDELDYVSADDDSGEDFNAHLHPRLFRGRTYVLRIRLYYSNRSGESAVMMW